MELRAAGMRIVMGTDTGQTRHWIGYYNHMALESFVAIGMTPIRSDRRGRRAIRPISPGSTPGWWRPARAPTSPCSTRIRWSSISNSRRINRVYLRGQEVPRAALAAKWQAQFNQTASTR